MIVDKLPYRAHMNYPAYVYLATGHPGGAWKIGRTSSFSDRAYNYRSQYDFPVTFVWAAKVADPTSAEKLLIDYFHHKCVKPNSKIYEWFYLNDDDVALIKATLANDCLEVIETFGDWNGKLRRKLLKTGA